MNTTRVKFSDAGLLDQIVTASSHLEAARSRPTNPDAFANSGGEEESEGEVFEDGDEIVVEGEDGLEEEQSGVAEVLTGLSQATTNATNATNAANSTLYSNEHINTTSNSSASTFQHQQARPNMTATINSINALLQTHLHGTTPASSSSLQHPHKVRLSGPIRANINIRHGVWAPRLRCRKRKNLHAKDGIWINASCTIEQLVGMVRAVLPDEFEWDPQGSPLRYQAVNDQSLQSLKTVSGTVASGQSLYAAFDLVRNRRSDGDNFILQLYVYGTWTAILKPHMISSSLGHQNQVEDDSVSNTLPPPPKKKYQQAHYNQQQQQQQMGEIVSSSPSESANTSNNQNNQNNPNVFIRHPVLTQTSPFYAHHPLAANPPVTFLPTVTLEMKMNGIFVPVEVTRRSFIAAFRACSISKQQKEDVGANTSTVNSTSSSSSNISYITNNITPPPSDA